MQQEFEYYAFISYCHKDKKMAVNIQRKLESYHLPSFIRKQKQSIPKKIKVYRDDTDAETGEELPEVLKKALKQSKFLLLLCTAESARSHWVGWEIQIFIELNRRNNIIPIIIDGEPYSDNPEKECFHINLIKSFPKRLGTDNAEILGVKIRNDIPRFAFFTQYVENERAFIRIIARLWSIPLGILWRKHKIHLIKRWLSRILSIILFILCIYIVWWHNKPMDISVNIEEITPHNNNLPEGDEGELIMLVGKDTIRKEVYGVNHSVSFHQIPGAFLNTDAQLLFHMYGFNDIDTIIRLTNNLNVSISRNIDIYGFVKGHVRDARTDLYLSNCVVEIESITSVTDTHGYFEMYIPLSMQRTVYSAIIRYNGQSRKIEDDIYPMQGDERRINTIYFE